MSKKIKIIGLAGSLREKSFNRMLLKAAANAVSDQCEFEIETIEGIPLYNQDLEDLEGVPARVKGLQNKIAASDGLLLVTPEYNFSIPGTFKHAIDYLTRPPKEIARVFGNLPVGLMGATPGGRGTVSAQEAWLPILKSLHTLIFTARAVGIPKTGDVFAEEGTIKDEKVQKQINEYMKEFEGFVQRHCRAKNL